MTKFKTSEAYTIHEFLATFLTQHSDSIMGKPSVIFHYNFRVIHDGLAEYITERDKIINKYGTKDENGVVSIPADSEEAKKAIEEIDEIGKIEIKVPIILMDLQDLYKLSEQVPADIIGALVWMTKEYQEIIDKEKDKE